MWRFFKPLSLRARYLIATALVVLTLSLAYGVVAIIGYSISFDKTAIRLLRGESNLYYSLAQWQNGQLILQTPPGVRLNFPSLGLIYDQHGKLLWQQRDVPLLESSIKPSWLEKPGFYELNTTSNVSQEVVGNSNIFVRQQLQDYDNHDNQSLTHSVVVNQYAATKTLPALTIVIIDTIPRELQRSDHVWLWFTYVLLANLFLVTPLLWLAAYWSISPIQQVAQQVRELEQGERDALNENSAKELRPLIHNLNLLLRNERQRYQKYRTALADLTHSLKTPLAVLQSTLRSLRGANQVNIEQAEPIMLEQINRISQQVGYHLHRATLQGEKNMLNREVHSASALLDSLCLALNKVYQHKGVHISLHISPEVTFIGEKNDFLEIVGNVLDNACKYCLEFVQISAIHDERYLHLVVEDDGPGIADHKREDVFRRGQRADTLQPGQGLGLAIVADIIEQYQGKITVGDSPLGGAKIDIFFAREH